MRMVDAALFLWPFFWLGIVVTAAYAFSLYYHWVRFANIYPLVWFMLPIYTVGVLIFIGAMIAGINAA